ncbi:hypothetical protein [Rubellicoccus peritrichatus]|uniref:Uncharacterized protein n=1 Tax=Rubellicoccus peritrichatus TaxID=3080537 RepID=A0AAQ3QQT7_9BACT|nr:hypothetical protein [Puniceicoccus sp. CR14]WOO40598.1 hypothetical protein RZN69_18405 [Puniceicoccus sp. CR14]
MLERTNILSVILLICFANIGYSHDFVPQDIKNLPTASFGQPTPQIDAPQGAGQITFDRHGNFWTLVSEGKNGNSLLYVLPAQNPTVWEQDSLSNLPEGKWRWVLADFFGYIWISDGRQLLRMSPHNPQNGWQEISADNAFPNDSITAMALSPSGLVMLAFQKGGIVELDQIRPNGSERHQNQISQIDSPANINQLQTDMDGNIWAKAGNKIYRKAAESNAWQKDWKRVASMPGGSHDLGGEVLDGVFYMDWAITGEYGYPSYDLIHSKLISFNPKNASWNIVADYGLPRGYCGVGILNGKIWTAGGASINENGERYNTAMTQVFDPETGEITKGPDLPLPLPSALALSSGGRLYILGFPEGEEATLKLYSIGSDETEWRIEPEGPSGIGSSYGTALNGKLYTVISHSCIAIFDPKTRTWETTEAPNSPRSPAVGHYNGEIWVMGGRNKEAENISYIYTPKSKTWRKGPNLPHNLIWGAAFNIDGELYVTGGCEGRGYSNATYKLRSSNKGAN